MPSFDDVDDKLRRNVMYVSTIVIVTFILELKVPISAHLVTGLMDPPYSSTNRVWLLAIALIFYCLSRYHFSPSRKERSTEYRVERNQKRAKLATALIAPTLVAAANRKAAAQERAAGITEPFEQRWFLDDVHVKNVWMDGMKDIRHQSGWSDDGPEDFNQFYQVGEEWERFDHFPLSWKNAFFFHFKVAFTSSVHSRGAFEVLAPYVLAGAAMLCCIYRYVQSWLL